MWLCLVGIVHSSRAQELPYGSIDRRALVSRHRIVLHAADTLGSLSVGNGEFAYTADASGLQSFPEEYERGVSIGTQAQWGWHSFPNPEKYDIEEVWQSYATCNNRQIPIAIQHKQGRKADAANYLRANPHRLQLGLIGLRLLLSDGTEATMSDLRQLHQELDMWSGELRTSYLLEGEKVEVVLYGHQEKDGIAFRITSPLLVSGRLKVTFRFPYGKDCHVCPGYDWDAPEKHTSRLKHLSDGHAIIHRTLDETHYQVGIKWTGDAGLAMEKAHLFVLTSADGTGMMDCAVVFRQGQQGAEFADFAETKRSSEAGWDKFWISGGAIDFSGCTDVRAFELERRVVLSQYLTKVQCAGSLPPQETGLTFNSWYGKFHLEMHWWHGVHFALWNRPTLLEKSMPWYSEVLPEARRKARSQGFDGVRWQKMSGPEGVSSPSSIGEFLIWQQPHPIYFAELLYRARPSRETLARYREIVFKTADFMADFAQLDSTDGHYHLCAPLIPAQEIFPAAQTNDPPFELVYWKYALEVAMAWRQRLGMKPKPRWEAVARHLAPLPERDGRYLPAAGAIAAYTNPEYRRDHPVITGAYGVLPGAGMVQPAQMEATFQDILSDWQWESTWGWDYPMLAMCAARLGLADKAIDALLLDTQKNTYLVNGHNYQDQRLRIYLPGNGGLLSAVAMMAAGWDGSSPENAPGFPHDGKWNIRWEGLQKMP